jgi:hypothetical protein
MLFVGISVTDSILVKCSGEVASGSLRIGAVSAPVHKAQEKMKVPDVLFYDNVQVRALLCVLGQVTVYIVVVNSVPSATYVYLYQIQFR